MFGKKKVTEEAKATSNAKPSKAASTKPQSPSGKTQTLKLSKTKVIRSRKLTFFSAAPQTEKSEA